MLTLYKIIYRSQNVAYDAFSQLIKTINQLNQLNRNIEETEIDFQPGEWLFVTGESEILYQEKLKLRQKEISNLNHREVVKGLGKILEWTTERFKDLPQSIKTILSESRITNDMRFSTIRITLDDVFIRMRPQKSERSLFQTREHDEIAKLMHMASTPATEEGLSSSVIAQMLWIIEVRSFIAVDKEFEQTIDKIILRTQIFDSLIKRWCEAWKACKRTILNQSRLPAFWRDEMIRKQIAAKPADAKFNDGPVSDNYRMNHWLLFNKNQTLNEPTNENESNSSMESVDSVESINLISIYEPNEESQNHPFPLEPLINDFSTRKKMLENNLVFFRKTSPRNKTNKVKIS